MARGSGETTVRGSAPASQRTPVTSGSRTTSDPSTNRPSISSEERAITGAGVTIQYVDRYVYVSGSMVTATVFEMAFAWGDVSEQEIFSLLAGAIIAEVNVWMLEEFNGVGPVLTIGKQSDTDELMNTTEVDPSMLSSFSTRPGKEYSSGDIVKLYMTPGAGASAGRGVLSIYII